MSKTYTQLHTDNPSPALDGTELLALDKGLSTVGATVQQVVDLAVTQIPAGEPGADGATGAAGAAGPNLVSTATATDITGILKGNGATVAQASAGTDYAAPLGTDDNYVTDAEKTALHAHTNKSTLDKISEAAGLPLWNGAAWPGGSAPTNTAPVATAQSVSIAKNASAYSITLVATDADGNALTYSIVGNPAHGTLGGTASNITYTPTADYYGADSFTFRAHDGTAYSNTATVSTTVVNTAVTQVPDPPTGVVLVASNTQISVLFTPPVYSGTSPITGYTASTSAGGFTATGTGSPLTITGLTNGTSYSISVVATNAVGNSTATTGVSATPIAPPGIPQNINAIPQDSQIQLAWSAPVSGGPVYGYNVYWTADGTVPTKGSSKISNIPSGYIHTGRANGTSYRYTVSAFNAAGESGLSGVAIGIPAGAIVSPTTGLTAEYLFNEGSGTSLANSITGTPWAAMALAGSPAWAADGVTFDTGAKYASMTLSPATQYTAWTIYAVARTNGARTDSYNGLVEILHQASSTYDYTVSMSSSNQLAAVNVNHVSAVTFQSSLTIIDGQWHVVVMTYDGSTVKLYVDGVYYASVALASFAPTMTVAYLARLNGVSLPWMGRIGYMSFFSVAHTSAEVYAKTLDIRSKTSAKGITLVNRMIICEGDSITSINAPNGGVGKINRGSYAFPANTAVTAISGSSLSNIASHDGSASYSGTNRAGFVDSLASDNNTRNVLYVCIGANNGGQTSAQFYSDLVTYVNARKAAHSNLKVAVTTVLPQTAVGSSAWRSATNALIIANTGNFDAIVRYDLITNMGADSDAANTTYYSDGVHPTAAGQALLAPVMRVAVNSILE